MSEKQKKVFLAAGVALAVYLGMKYVLRLTAPFFLAWILVRLLNPLAEWIHKRIPLKKEWITLFLLILFLASLCVGCYYLAGQLLIQLRSVIQNLDLYKQEFFRFLEGCSVLIEQNLGIQMEDTLSFVDQNLAALSQKISVSIVPGLFSNSLQWVLCSMKAAGALFLVLLAATLLMKDYDAILAKFSSFSLFAHLSAITERLFSIGGTWLKSQLVILLIVIAICSVSLWLLKNPYALLLGILIGLLDALPFLGTGTILLPWALFCCLKQDFFHAAAYTTVFLVANTTREYLEPKLLGDKLGVYPIVIALVVYVGLCIYGPSGVLLGPLSMLLIQEILGEFEIFPPS
jgi:sporulation integral membrane protein YtvI